ncbi:MAG: ATP-grasp domain-containing protein [Bacteroidetes bacterium]|nr:MAG: ATP-grasp domain-containing protein [Bacteroidota bacterium]
MRKIKVLITGVGAPGIKGTLFSLLNNYDNRAIYTVGTDINDEVVGKYLCNVFYKISRANDSGNYLSELSDICKKEKVEIIIPQNTSELEILAFNKEMFNDIGVKILISGQKSINIANNKYKLLNVCKKIHIPVLNFQLVNNFNDLIFYARAFGWPGKEVVIKPPVSNGLRGVRIINEHIDQKAAFYSEKPNSLYISSDYLHSILGDFFPELLVMDYLPGDEYSVDILNTKQNIIVIPRKRDLIRSGITFNGSLEKNLEIITYSSKLAKHIGLQYCFGFQFKLNNEGIPIILECNPRIQGTMVLSTFAGANLIYSAVKYLLNEPVPDLQIDWDTHLLRYWGAVSINKNGLKELI